MEEGFLHTNKQCGTGWLAFRPTRFQHYLRQHQIPRVKSSVLQDCPLPLILDANHKPKWSPILLTDQLQVGSFNDPLLGFAITLLEWLTEFRKLISTRLPIDVIKERNSGTAKWKRHVHRSTGKGRHLFLILASGIFKRL